MCHSNLEIEFGDFVNFISGQNGSGKSAILTALCVAFGSRARGTQRANTLKDFIKTGCSYALVQVEIKNQGPDAFKPDVYGDVIVVERRISEYISSITLKNRQGRRVGTKRDDLREVIEHFNIDVENPCVIMSQEKSREFLHSGSAKDKFKFFYKATLLQRVDDLLKGIENQLSDATALLNHLEQSLRPVLKELDELQEKIKGMEFVEEFSLQLQMVKKKLAWAWVYDAERKLGEKSKEIEKLKARKLSCQQRIDEQHHMMEELSDQLAKKKREIENIMERTSEVNRMTEELHQSYSMARKEELELESEQDLKTRQIQNIALKIELLEQQIHDFHEQHIKGTQAEENEIEEKLRELEVVVGKAKDNCQSLQANEDEITKEMAPIENDIKDISNKIKEARRREHDISSRIGDLQMHQRNKVTAFGGRQVINLLQAIEQNQLKFTRPPIGPIGAHVKLINGDKWSIAVESAVGRLLDAFIVTNYKDALTLRECARRVHHWYLQIIIYEFSRPRLEIPWHMLPETSHPTVLSVLHTDNHIVRNVLIDLGSAEMQVLVKDYEVGNTIAFNPNIKNVKEVFTSYGSKLFQCHSAQTILPPYKKLRTDHLCASYDDQITNFESERDALKANIQENQGVQRTKENELNNLRELFKKIKRSKECEEHKLRLLEFELQDLRNSLTAEAETAPAFNVDELNQEISDLREEIQGKRTVLEKLQIRVDEAELKAKDLDVSLKNFVESTNAELGVLSKAEDELITLETKLFAAETEKKYYQASMCDMVLTKLKNVETEYVELGNESKEIRRKASIICPESDVEDLNCEEINPEHLSAQVTTLNEKCHCESRRFLEPIEDLRMIFEKKQRNILRKLQTYKALREKLEVYEKALELRWIKFKKNATDRIRELRWEFNGHLVKKGIQGRIRVNVEEKTLSIEVKMPQDASNTAVHDTRGLSGGERSFSTLCFALTIHGMTEAPFRAMDEFDVFMDAVSRKISLDAVVDFALEKGSQWILITPHDISIVRDHERIKKQQMAAPRG